MGAIEANIIEAREAVEQAKRIVRGLNDAMHAARGRSHGKNSFANFNAEYQKAIAVMQQKKLELTKLCGTTGSDPRWDLVRRAYAVLTRLDDAGVDIGEHGAKLLDDIEFHVPQSKLSETLEEIPPIVPVTP